MESATVFLVAGHDNPTWAQDGLAYRFPDAACGDATICMSKHRQGILDISVTDANCVKFQQSVCIPPMRTNKLLVCLWWSGSHLGVKINGNQVFSSFPEEAAPADD